MNPSRTLPNALRDAACRTGRPADSAAGRANLVIENLSELAVEAGPSLTFCIAGHAAGGTLPGAIA